MHEISSVIQKTAYRPTNLVLVLMTWVHRHQTRNYLARLDPHLLSDVGLTETEVRFECSKKFWQD